MFLLISALIMSSLYGYVEWRLISVLATPSWVKLIISILLFCSIFNLWAVLFWGHILPESVCQFFSFTQVWLVYLFVATVIFDLLKFTSIKYENLPIILLFVATIIACYSVYNAKKVPTVKEVNIAFKTENFEPLKIVQLTDFHIGQGFDKEWLKKVVEKTNALKPDLIAITGDSVDDQPEILGEEVEPLKNLKSTYGTFMVFGNHEYYHGAKKWKPFFENLGITVLKNEAIELQHGTTKFKLVGLDFGAKFNEEKGQKIVENVLINEPNETIKIVLAHHPQSYNLVKKKKNTLQLSGHTHGGHSFPVNLLVWFFNDKLLRGLYAVNDSYLYISDGTGLWGGFLSRFGSQNEITQITISSGK